MPVSAHQARTSLAITASAAALAAVLLLSPRDRDPAPTRVCTPGDVLCARLSSTAILAGVHDIAVTITMPRTRARCGVLDRLPLSIAIVIDRSGSMAGDPLRDAKAAAAQLVDQLDAHDAFSIITYSSSAEVVVPMQQASAEHKAAARALIERVRDEGNTCISCGIELAGNELARARDTGVRRVVLISDGQANMGRVDRNDLAELASATAASGVSISTVGVGLDFDELTLTRIADVGRGRYHFVEDTAQLGELFAQEIDDLAQTVATEARLVISDTAGVIEDVYGYPFTREGNQVIVPIADLRDDETRNVVVRARVDGNGSVTVAQFSLHWKHVQSGALHSARTRLDTTIVRDPARVQATLDRSAVGIIEQARAARMLEHATTVYETQGQAAAQKWIERSLRDVRANAQLDDDARAAIEQVSATAIDNFANAPAAKALKATRADAYELAH